MFFILCIFLSMDVVLKNSPFILIKMVVLSNYWIGPLEFLIFGITYTKWLNIYMVEI